MSITVRALLAERDHEQQKSYEHDPHDNTTRDLSMVTKRATAPPPLTGTTEAGKNVSSNQSSGSSSSRASRVLHTKVQRQRRHVSSRTYGVDKKDCGDEAQSNRQCTEQTETATLPIAAAAEGNAVTLTTDGTGTFCHTHVRSVQGEHGRDEHGECGNEADCSNGAALSNIRGQPAEECRLRSSGGESCDRAISEGKLLCGGKITCSDDTSNHQIESAILIDAPSTLRSMPSPLSAPGAATMEKPQHDNNSSGRGGSVFSPNTLRSLRNFLTFGSGAQVAPASSPPIPSKYSNYPGTMTSVRSSFSYATREVALGKGSGGKIAPALIDNATRSNDFDVGSCGAATDCKRRGRIFGGGEQNSSNRELGETTVGAYVLEGDERTGSTEKKNAVEDATPYTDSKQTDTCTSNGNNMWPTPLDDEAEPSKWALKESDKKVLAAAINEGSVLVRTITWNLHAKPTPGPEELRKVLLPPGKFHIFAIGTEECLNSIAKSMIVHSKREWECLLKETLGSSYEMLRGHSLQATHNTVFVHRGIIPLLGNVRSFAIATGLSLGARGTTLGNKGGVGIAFDLGATSCIFVNSHFAAHQNNVAERNEDFFQIQHGLVQALATPNTAGPQWKLSCIPAALLQVGVLSPSAVAFATAADHLVSQPAQDAQQINGDPAYSNVVNISNPSDSPLAAATLPAPNITPSFGKADDTAMATRTKVTTEGNNRRTPLCATETSGTVPPPSNPISALAGPKRSNGLLLSPFRHRGPDQREHDRSNRGVCPTLPQAFDRVVWAGDLNYRINAARTVVDLLIAKGMHEVLEKNDQLLLQRERPGEGRGVGGSAFAGYQEGPLNFRPTYKFDSGTDTYDTSAKRRVPAWTDRVLFAAHESWGQDPCRPGLELKAYRSVEELRTSDHRPVLASFVMRFNAPDWAGDKPTSVVTNKTSSEVCSLM